MFLWLDWLWWCCVFDKVTRMAVWGKKIFVSRDLEMERFAVKELLHLPEVTEEGSITCHRIDWEGKTAPKHPPPTSNNCVLSEALERAWGNNGIDNGSLLPSKKKREQAITLTLSNSCYWTSITSTRWLRKRHRNTEVCLDKVELLANWIICMYRSWSLLFLSYLHNCEVGF